MRTNKLTSIYCDQAKALNEASDHEKCIEIINQFKNRLGKTLPSEEEFLSKVKELTYIKNEHSQKNVLSKIFLNEIENLISGCKNNKEDSSVEHLLNEDLNCAINQKVDRLMLLEQEINNSIPKIPLTEKTKYYKKSNYSVPKQIVDILSKTEPEKLEEVLDNWFKENALKFYRSIN